MEDKTYALLISILTDAGLTKNGVPDFDKIAEITGHSRDSLKVFLAPSAITPRWVKLLQYVGKKKYKFTEEELIDEYENYFGMIHGIDEAGQQQIKWIMSLLKSKGLLKDTSPTKENTEVTC